MEHHSISSIIEHINDWQLGLTRSCCGKRVKHMSFLTSRQGMPGSYCHMFAPIEGEVSKGYVVVTGERMTSDASARHVLGEEALRALILMKPKTKSGQAAIQHAEQGLLSRLAEDEQRFGYEAATRGTYCCGKCSVAYWRALASGAYNNQPARLRQGMQSLNQARDGKTGWRNYPFYYTVAALSEIEDPQAVREIRYAQSSIERRLNQLVKSKDNSIVSRRRQRYLELALARLN